MALVLFFVVQPSEVQPEIVGLHVEFLKNLRKNELELSQILLDFLEVELALDHVTD